MANQCKQNKLIRNESVLYIKGLMLKQVLSTDDHIILLKLWPKGWCLSESVSSLKTFPVVKTKKSPFPYKSYIKKSGPQKENSGEKIITSSIQCKRQLKKTNKQKRQQLRYSRLLSVYDL